MSKRESIFCDAPANLYVDLKLCKEGYFDVCPFSNDGVEVCEQCLRDSIKMARDAYSDFCKRNKKFFRNRLNHFIEKEKEESINGDCKTNEKI